MSASIVPYGDNNINVLSPAPASGTGGALLLGNDQALSNAIDALNTKYLSLNGGTLIGALSINENFGNYGILNFCNNTGEVQLQEVYYGNSQKLKFLDASGNLLFSIGLNQSVNTNANTLDDGTGNMVVAGTLTGPSGGNNQLETVRGCIITGNSVIPSGTIASVYIPANATVTRWAVISTDGTTGSITFDIQQSALGSGLYTSMTGNSIVNNGSGGAYPHLSNQTTNSSSTLTNWTTNLTGGNYLVFVVNGTPTSVKNVRLELTLVPR